MALVIHGLGLYLANIGFDAVRRTGSTRAEAPAWLARAPLNVLVAAMALARVKVAQAMVQDAFRAVLLALAAARTLPARPGRAGAYARTGSKRTCVS